jgi:ornithine carbamoyltransferase
MPGPVVPHLMTLADLSVPQLKRLLAHSHYLKQVSLPWLEPQSSPKKASKLRLPSQSLFNKTIALLFSKRSTRTRLASETSAVLLGGRALFLGREDIQLGVNESPRDTARVIGGMCQGIFARVGEHEEIEVRRTEFSYPHLITVFYTGTGKILACSRSQCTFIPMASHANTC